LKLFLRKIVNYPAPVRLGIFLLVLLLVWLPLATPIYLLVDEDPNLVAIATMGLLFIQFLILQKLWGKYIYRQPKILQQYGLVWTRKNGIELLNGLAIGFCFCWGLFICEAILGWVKFSSPSISLLRIITEGLLSALGIGLAEELVFRGWILTELERDYVKQIVLWTNALIFAIAHFIKPLEEIIRTWVTFPALVILGLTLVWAKWGYGDRLGICIGLHAGLVWGYYILNVGQLFEYTNKVPTWITGIDGNPIAGLMGLVFLSIIAWWMRKLLVISH
jgi:membrane protease YdiL (CAAX protease family)